MSPSHNVIVPAIYGHSPVNILTLQQSILYSSTTDSRDSLPLASVTRVTEISSRYVVPTRSSVEGSSGLQRSADVDSDELDELIMLIRQEAMQRYQDCQR